MNTSARFTFDKVVFDKTNAIHAVLSLTAPKLDRISKRPPVCIIPVIDISGSMAGQKLDFAKKSIAKLIDHLSPGDYFGAVAFESAIFDVFPTTPITDTSKLKMHAEISKLRTIGGTNMAGGILRGLDFAKAVDLPKEVLIRVILFTDGGANEGVVRDKDGLSKLMTANMGERATLSMFGYGNDADQELLTSLAVVGKGNYAFIDSPDKASTAFAKELGGLLSTYAQNITIEVEPLGDNEITKVVSDVTVTDNDKDKKIKIEMADILSEESRHIVLALKTGVQKQVFPRPINILAVKVEYDLIDDTGKKTKEVKEIKGKIEFVKSGDEQKEPTQDVVDIVAVQLVLEAQVEAEQHAASGNFAAAYNVMVGLQGACGPQGAMGHQGCQGAVGMAGDLAKKYVDKGTYRSSAGSRNAYRALASSRALFADEGTEQVMFSCNVSNTNSAQQAVIDSFAVSDADSLQGISVQQTPGQQGAVGNTLFTTITPTPPTSSSSGLKKSRSRRW
jgi:Ca-activated chloride channel family protein